MNCCGNCCMDRKRTAGVLAACLLALLLAALLDLGLGAVPIRISDLLAGLRQGGESVESRILLQIRVPRLLAAVLAGAALAVCGSVLQTVLANPLASPLTPARGSPTFSASPCCRIGRAFCRSRLSSAGCSPCFWSTESRAGRALRASR